MLLIKLVLTPLLMWLVSAAGRRWGSRVGGLLAGLPLTSAPISIYLFIEQGRDFAANAAISSLAGVSAIAVFSLVYAGLAGRLSMIITGLVSLVSFFATLMIFHWVHPTLWSAFIVDMILVVSILQFIPSSDRLRGKILYPSWDLPLRMVTSTSLVLIVTLSARFLGPSWSGLLSPIPVIAWPLILFAHVHEGTDGALAALRGNLQGAYGVATFYLIVASLLPLENPFLTYFLAISGSVVCIAPFIRRKKKQNLAPQPK